MSKIHYIWGYGSAGCLYDYMGCSVSADAAVETCQSIYDLTDEEAECLKEHWHFDKEEWVLYSLSINDCDCDTPWVHEECPDEHMLFEWIEWLNESARYVVCQSSGSYFLYDTESNEIEQGMLETPIIEIPDYGYHFQVSPDHWAYLDVLTWHLNRTRED